MATLRQYFDTDFKHVLSGHRTRILGAPDGNLEVVERLHFDFNSNTTYISYFIPANAHPYDACLFLINNTDLALSLLDSFESAGGYIGEELMSTKDLKFSGRVFLYHENDLPQQQLHSLKEIGRHKNLSVQFRGPTFDRERAKLESPLAFISHDARDKEEIGRPLALQLSKLMCPVWYDEYSLKVGDNLRESIEKGLKECRKCILILTPNYLTNERWSKREFNSVFTRELIEQKDVILPIWHGVTEREVYEYSPSLANKFAIKWGLGVEEVSRQLYRAITS